MKAQRTRRFVSGISLLVALVSIIILAVMLMVGGLQKKHLTDLANDVKTNTNKLKNEPQINEILTVQNQLESLTALHAAKPEASQLFTYLNQVTPAKVNINDISVDFTQDTITITGSTDTLSSVNQYVDTLKLTTYTTNQTNTSAPAFSNVVLSSFSVSASGNASTAASYSVNFKYDPTIFNITQSTKLHVPSTTTTRAGLDSLDDLFKSTDKAAP
ncbi:MAG TPA: PilN domain-containing protein [Candidatus Saccharimonadales bacterium]|nr:PilN domain-containing protein [Candidatus Saccharimonadales bacterium]